MDGRALYDRRFSAAERAAKARLWDVLCRDFLQRYVRLDDAVLDVGAGLCEFINAIRCREKWAVDVDAGMLASAEPDVTVHPGPAHDLAWLPAERVNVVFASNVFEHFERKTDVLAALAEIRRVLRPAGRLLVLQPNIRFAYREYWDFFDHHLPFSERAMVEALEASGLRVQEVRARFLPYTTKRRRIPVSPLLARVYLRLPILQALLGKQMFIVAEKP